MIDNKYNPSEIEEKWYKEWEEKKAFSPSGDGDAYCIMIPPPNVTGTLHMGHAFQVTLMDILCRYHRMYSACIIYVICVEYASFPTPSLPPTTSLVPPKLKPSCRKLTQNFKSKTKSNNK